METIDPLLLYVISADSLARAGLVALLNGMNGYRVVGQGDLDHLSDVQFDSEPPDVIVWDMGWDGDVDEGELGLVLEMELPTAVLLVDGGAAPKLLRAGILGLLLRNSPIKRLTAALSAINEELTVIDPDLQGVLVGSAVSASYTADLLEPLTPRENEVLNLLAQGLTNKAIGATLDISPHTVKFHVTAIMEKLDAQSRTEAVVQATRLGLLQFS